MDRKNLKNNLSLDGLKQARLESNYSNSIESSNCQIGVVGLASKPVTQKYGVTFSEKATDADFELWFAFDVNFGGQSLHEASGFLGAFEHLRRAIDLIWNSGKEQHLIWNEWTEKMLKELITNRELSLAGPGGSWKTTCLACYALCRWMASPLDTRVIITSTTLDGLRSRIWKEVNRFYRASRCGFGNAVNHPHPKIQTVKGDDGTGIFGIAVEQGDVDRAVENIKGRHAPNTLVEVDEMTGVSEAIVKAGANLEKGTRSFQMHGSANPVSYFDQHGMFSEPEDGWESISVESEKWKTKRGGMCLHLDGTRAPNVLAGRQINPGMISLDDIEISKRRDGENSPIFWSQVRGFWPPEGIEKTVLSQSLITKFHARDVPIWVGDTIIGAACDPAFEGGDRKPLGFWKCGRIKLEDKKWQESVFGKRDIDIWAICFLKRILLRVDVTLKEPVHYQLARQINDNLRAEGVSSKYFGIDVTGEGGGVASILKREHGLLDFVEVEFGGMASSRAVSPIDSRPSREVYGNRVTELWYQFRRGLELNRVRGLDIDVCKEFCQRQYDLQGKLIVVESKKKMKLRTGGISPDLADEAVVMYETFLQRIPEFGVSAESRKTNNAWREFVMKRNLEPEYSV